MQPAKVVKRHKGEDGLIQGTYSDNPIANTIMYDVEFSDGTVREYAANVIAENLFDQVDADGYSHSMLDSIVDVRKTTDAVYKDDMYITTKSGQRRLRQTTAGWEFLVRWKDGQEQWVHLAILKESNPVDVAEFVKSRGLETEPAFRWWIPYTLKKRDRTISAVNSRVRRASHKYGIEIPTSVTHAYEIEKWNGNTFWSDAISKVMGNLIVAFDILPDGEPLPKGWTLASGHIVFDVKMTLERKARWVKDGHKTPDPSWSTFAGVVSRESVRIALTYAALNDIPVCGADIQNAYLQAPSSEMHYIICGEEFGLENVGKRALIRRALYGGKSAGSDYWRHVRQAIYEMGFKPCPADPDVWIRAGVKFDETKIWDYVLLYTDDILAIMQKPEKFLRNEFAQKFVLKPSPIGEPSQYLGNKVSKVALDGGVSAWAFSSSQYVQSACKNVDDHRVKNGLRPLPACKSPWPSNYRPEADVTPDLDSMDASYYQFLIGVLRWIVELGRADVAIEVSGLASQMALPRKGHLDEYVQSACKNVDDHRVKNGLRPLPACKSPWPSNYRPEADVTPDLDSMDASYYQFLIGVLRWIVELGRADVAIEVSGLASQMALPRKGHLDAVYQMFAFLKTKHNSQMVFHPTVPEINESCFIKQDWSASAYGDCKEVIPDNAPEARGLGFIMRDFVDADHAVFLNGAPIHWFSKKQTSVETSSFGSEFIAMKRCCEYVRGLRYKLRMMGIPVEAPTYVFGDNQAVLANITMSHSTLKKKSSSVAYHFVREGVAKDEWRVTYLNTHFNPADLLTKSLPGGEKRTRFTGLFLHYVN